jgi:3-deoxy-D-manno-octulosonate 8-phosphate phosphatase (KDO 8-P phosphatase)
MLTAYLPAPVLSVSTEGEILRTMNIRDGYAMKAAVESGYNVLFLAAVTKESARLREI